MHKWLYKILFIVISFSFFVSATEMDLGDCHNTFFDEYDTYVQSEQVVLEHSSTEHKNHDQSLLCGLVIFNHIHPVTSRNSVKPITASFASYHPLRLFLRYSVMRI